MVTRYVAKKKEKKGAEIFHPFPLAEWESFSFLFETQNPDGKNANPPPQAKPFTRIARRRTVSVKTERRKKEKRKLRTFKG